VDREGVAWASLDERELVSQVEQVSNDSKIDGLKLEVWFKSPCCMTLVSRESSLGSRFLLLAVPTRSGISTGETWPWIVLSSAVSLVWRKSGSC
jgi:hypothetical protein